MKTMNKTRRGDLFELMGTLSLLWALCREKDAPEDDYSFFDNTTHG